MDQRFRMEERTFEGGLILDLIGDITKSAEDILLGHRNWETGLGAGRSFLVFNFTEVPYINSAGIALLIRITRQGKKAGLHTFAYGLSSHYQKLFRMVGLAGQMMIYPDEYAILQRIEELGSS